MGIASLTHPTGYGLRVTGLASADALAEWRCGYAQ